MPGRDLPAVRPHFVAPDFLIPYLRPGNRPAGEPIRQEPFAGISGTENPGLTKPFNPMYTREQASLVKESFWRVFGQKMATQRSWEGKPIKWINYETGIRHLSFKMDADSHSAAIWIELSNPDTGLRALLYDQFLEVRHLLQEYLEEEWHWEPAYSTASGKTLSRISACLENVNLFKPEDQPVIFRFFRKRLIALDRFWCETNPAFEIFKD